MSEKSFGISETKRGILEEIMQLVDIKTFKFISESEWKTIRKTGAVNDIGTERKI